MSPVGTAVFRHVSTLIRVSASTVRSKSSAAWDRETHLGLVRRARRMNRSLAVAFPHVYCELDFTNPLELTVATILRWADAHRRQQGKWPTKGTGGTGWPRGGKWSRREGAVA